MVSLLQWRRLSSLVIALLSTWHSAWPWKCPRVWNWAWTRSPVSPPQPPASASGLSLLRAGASRLPPLERAFPAPSRPRGVAHSMSERKEWGFPQECGISSALVGRALDWLQGRESRVLRLPGERVAHPRKSCSKEQSEGTYVAINK